MKKRTKRRIKGFLHSFLFITLPVFCFIGALTGTISWYSLNAKVSATYHGASISSSKQLQVGLVSDIDLSDVGLVMEDGVGWSSPGDGLLPEQVEAFLERKGFASIKLPALTTGEFHNGDPVKLKYSPNAEIKTSKVEAKPEDYVNLPLAFRVINSSKKEYLANQKIWLTDSFVNTNMNASLETGIRVHFETNIDGDTFLFEPKKDASPGDLDVGGLMDLDFNGYYDYEENGDEILYGDYEGVPTRTSGHEEDSDYDDINHTGAAQGNTFYAKHKANKNWIEDYTSVTFKKQHYETLSSVSPVETDTGFQGGKPVCITEEGNKIGYTTMTIWLEGWDHVVVDAVAGFMFSLNLTFEINRI